MNAAQIAIGGTPEAMLSRNRKQLVAAVDGAGLSLIWQRSGPRFNDPCSAAGGPALHPTAGRATRSGRGGCRAFTLVELLVATTVSLLLIFAMAQAFTVVSETIRANRATIEMASGLRQVTWRLQQDLEGVTAPVRPWIQSSWGQGYFEYVDGPRSDLDADGDNVFDYAQSPVPNLSLGDLDDVLMFTARRVESPFTGRWRDPANANNVLYIQSEFAEVAWWVGLGDTNQNGVLDPGENFVLYRRALLIRPDLNGTGGFFAQLGPYNPTNQSDLQTMSAALLDFMNNNDLSVHFERQPSGSNVILRIVANSLADLTLRQNRFCHDPVVYEFVSTPGQLVFLTQANFDQFFPYPLNDDVVAHPFTGLNNPIRGALALQRVIQSGIHLGEDVMLANLLAFDVRAFDPLAILSAHVGNDGQWGEAGVDDDGAGGTDDVGEAGWPGTDDEVVGPGDRGYGDAGNVAISATGNILPVGRGAYVDLNFHNKFGITTYNPAQSLPHFGNGNAIRSQLIALPANPHFRLGTYDTWPFDYEIDGLDTDRDSPALVDEGTDGLDQDNPRNGVDDEGERETAPPYAQPLRGIRVTIRVIEPDTRQVLQTAVSSNFVPE